MQNVDKPKFSKVNLTQKDLPIMSMLLFCELILISVDTILIKKHRYTKKWRQVQNFLFPLVDKFRSIGSFLSYCFLSSGSLRENEMNETINQVNQVVLVLENMEDPRVAKCLAEAEKFAKLAIREKGGLK